MIVNGRRRSEEGGRTRKALKRVVAATTFECTCAISEKRYNRKTRKRQVESGKTRDRESARSDLENSCGLAGKGDG